MYKLYWRENQSNAWVFEAQFPSTIAALRYIVEGPAKKGEFGLWKETERRTSPLGTSVGFVDFSI